MSVTGALVSLGEVSSRLHELIPSLRFDPQRTAVAIVSSVPGLGERLVAAVGHDLSGLLFDVYPDPYPDLQRLSRSLHGIWMVCAADRYEFGGASFLDWADRHRALFARIPVYCINVIRSSQLPLWKEPVVPDSVIAGERTVAVAPMLLDVDAATFGTNAELKALQSQFIDGLLLLSVRYAAKYRPFTSLVTTWDLAASEAIDAAVPSTPPSSEVEAALLHLNHLHARRDVARSAVRLLDTAFAAANAIDDGHASADLARLSKKIAVLMNDGRSAFIEVPSTVGVDPFAAEYQQVRQRALRFTDSVMKELTALGRKEEAEVFAATRKEFAEDAKVVLLGAFSSGKSTFINSLLGLTEETNELPTSGRPETAVITEILEGREDLATVEEADRVNLTLFQRGNQPDERWKINREEFDAFLQWYAAGVVKIEELQSVRFARDAFKESSPRNAFTRRDADMFREFGRESEIDHRDRRELDRMGAICTLRNIRFSKPLKPPNPREVPVCFEWVKKPMNAFRVERVELQRPSPALHGLRMVDTPGTDSLIGHHHTLARSYIQKYKTAPVIYLFSASLPASEEDAKNLAFLRDLSTDRGRLFFAINKKNLVLNGLAGQKEILEGTMRRLRDAGMGEKRAYFIDALGARTNPDDEWTALVGDLRAFLRLQRTALVVNAMRDKLRAPLERLLANQHALVKDRNKKDADAARTAAAWERTLENIDAVIKRFEEQVESAEERLFRRAGSDFHDEVEELDDDLGAFDCGAWLTSKKNTKLAQIKALIEPLGDWPDRLASNLQNATRVLHAFLQSELSKEGAKLSYVFTRTDIPSDFHAFTVAKIEAEAASDVQYDFKFYTGWLESKVARLRELIGKETSAGTRRVQAKFNEIVESYWTQTKALRSRAKPFTRGPGKASDAEVKNAQGTIAFLERALREYAAVDE
jgi:energy-coupling factor transporter ATP-binding protein EcfA2